MGTVTYISTRTTKRQFRNYLSQDQAQRYRQLGLLLSGYYRTYGEWTGVKELIDELKAAYQERIIVTNSKGIVVADTQQKLLGQRLSESSRGKIGTLHVANIAVGTLYIRDRARSPIENKFLNSVNKSVILSGLISGVAAILLAFFYSRRIVKPIRSLTEASRKLKEGELDQHVDTDSRDEIGELARSFNSMASKLKEQERLRKNMVSDVSHELRTPVSNIQGYLEGVRDGVLDLDDETIQILHNEAQLLNQLVNDLHELTLAEAGQLDLHKRMVPVRQVITNTIDPLQAKIGSREVQVHTEFDSTVTFNVDPARIKQVLRNLLDNAMAHTDEDEVISISAWREDDHIVIEVNDTGEGIPQEELPYIFNRFYRVDKSRTRSTGGSGLGLTISKKIVEAHHGEISVVSEPGEGTSFTVVLPVNSDS